MLASLRARFAAWRAARRRPAAAYHSRHSVDEGLFSYMTEAPRLRRRLQRERINRAIRAARARNKMRRGARAVLAARPLSAAEIHRAEPVRSIARDVARTSIANNPVGSTEEMLLQIGVILHQPVRRHVRHSWRFGQRRQEIWAIE